MVNVQQLMFKQILTVPIALVAPPAYRLGKYKIQVCGIYKDAVGRRPMEDYGKRCSNNCMYEGKMHDYHIEGKIR